MAKPHTQFTVNDVISLKMQSGEEILGRYQGVTPYHICVEKPHTNAGIPDARDPRRIQFTLMPYMFTANSPDSTVKYIDLNHVTCAEKADQVNANRWLTHTTGIVTTGAMPSPAPAGNGQPQKKVISG